jgi:hypothetical protein
MFFFVLLCEICLRKVCFIFVPKNTLLLRMCSSKIRMQSQWFREWYEIEDRCFKM